MAEPQRLDDALADALTTWAAPALPHLDGTGLAEKTRRRVEHTCHGCDARWTGTRTAHCAGCHRSFSGLTLFDAHRSGRGEHGTCRHPDDLDGIELRDGVWSHPTMTAEQVAARWPDRSAS